MLEPKAAPYRFGDRRSFPISEPRFDGGFCLTEFLFCLKTAEVLSLSRHGVLILGWRASHGGYRVGRGR